VGAWPKKFYLLGGNTMVGLLQTPRFLF